MKFTNNQKEAIPTATVRDLSVKLSNIQSRTKEQIQASNQTAQTFKRTGPFKSKTNKVNQKERKFEGYEDEAIEYCDQWAWEQSETAKKRLEPKNKKRRP
jgi:hypothetical protein